MESKLTALKRFLTLLLDYTFPVMATFLAARYSIQVVFDPDALSRAPIWTFNLIVLLTVSVLIERLRVMRLLQDRTGDLTSTIGSIQRSVANVEGRLDSRLPPSLFFLGSLPDLRQAIGQANVIDICGTALLTFARDYHEQLAERIRRGAQVRFMILDPQSTAAAEMVKKYSWTQDVRNLCGEISTTLGMMQRFLEDPILSKTFKLRLLPYMPTYGLRVFDSQYLWAEVFSFRDPVEVTFKLDKSDGYWFEYLVRQFELMWNVAKPTDSEIQRPNA